MESIIHNLIREELRLLSDQQPKKQKIDVSKSLNYWKQALGLLNQRQAEFPLKVLDSIIKANGMATQAQINVIKRAVDGPNTPYHPKN